MRAFIVACGVAAACVVPSAQQPPPAPAADIVLSPTNHPRVSADAADLWMAPAGRPSRTTVQNEFAEAVKLEVDSSFAKALPILSQAALQQGVLGDYAMYYKGLAELRLGHPEDARVTFHALTLRTPTGYVSEAAAVREGESAEALGDQSGALQIYEQLSKTKTTAPDDVLMRVGRMAKATGDLDKAAVAFSRVYFEFPFGELASSAGAELERMPNYAPLAGGTNRYQLELGRAERFFGGKKYADARPGFEAIRRVAQGDDRELVALRLAECEYFLKRPRNARDGLRPYLESASRQGEALFFWALAASALGDEAEYMRTIRRVADEFPTQSWSEEALNNLATHYILQNEDDKADATFRELYERFPSGRYSERAAWKIGWWAYKDGRYADTVRVFERASADFPRSDYRPAWLYWSGRAYGAMNDAARADSRYTLTVTDYMNTYYGRLATSRLKGRVPQRRLVVDAKAPGAEPPVAQLPPNQQLVRALLALDLYDQAIDELRYAQKVWGDSSAIQATLGWIANRRGDLRGGINAVKRAYPQYMAAGGEQLPAELQRVIFPLNYWPEIRRYAESNHLDPYLMAALILQESNFTADIRSPANAYGLMQLLPSTGRRYVRVLETKRFSMSLLTRPEPNLRMGMAYFADLSNQFGGAHFALAGYNAGPNRVVRWKSTNPDAEVDEFIDDIPFPETQNYVKRIIGIAEDYRRLYGNDGAYTPAIAAPARQSAKASSSKTTQQAKSSAAKKGTTTTKKKPASTTTAKKKKA